MKGKAKGNSRHGKNEWFHTSNMCQQRRAHKEIIFVVFKLFPVSLSKRNEV